MTRFEYSYSSDGKLSSIYDKTLETVTEYTETGYKIYKGTLGNVIQLLYEYEGDEENYKEKILEETFQYSMETEEALSWLNVLDEAGADVYSEKTIYDDFERVKQKQTIVGDVVITQNYAYMVSNKVTGDRLRYYSAAYTSSSKYAAIGFNYAYDLNGNIVSIKTSANESGCTTNYQTTYTYDEAGQLTGAYDEAAGIRYAYSYDQHGNLMSKESYSVAEDGTETLLDQTIMEYDGMVLKNSYSSANGKTQYQYQAGKYLRYSSSSAGIISYGWGEGRMLNGIRNSSTGVISQYSYNEEGLRSQKILRKNSLIITTDYVWGKNGLEGFTNGEDTVVVLYGSDGMPVGFTLNGESYAYIKNLQGDVLRILDTNGTTVVEYTYDPWGAQTVTGDTELAAINPCSYRCYDYDEESGLYYLQSRYYNPETGRFLNADDTEYLQVCDSVLSYNIFTYCKNNPIAFEDQTGTIALTTCVIIGAVAGAIIGGVASKLIYGKVNGWWVLGGAVAGGVIGYVGGAFFGASGIKAGTLAMKIKMSKVRWLGQIGEKMAKWPKNKAQIHSLTKSANYRIPDYLDYDQKILGEVKNVKSLSFTKQIEDYLLFAEKKGLTFIIKTRPSRKLSNTLKKLVDAGRIVIEYL